jgi:hypothetical protein
MKCGLCDTKSRRAFDVARHNSEHGQITPPPLKSQGKSAENLQLIQKRFRESGLLKKWEAMIETSSPTAGR